MPVNLKKVSDICKISKPSYGTGPLVSEVVNVVKTFMMLYIEDAVRIVVPYGRKP